ncbi:hypothetical protein BJX70DRAFT_378878 [Aspergillus crustosus]
MSGWLLASALNSVLEIRHTSWPGKCVLQACTRPITKSHLASSCCDCGARVDTTNSPDCRLEVILYGKIKIMVTYECKRSFLSGKHITRTTARCHNPLCWCVARST